MDFKIGQKVAYPNIGVCSIEKIENKNVGGNDLEFYSLRLISNGSVVFIPTAKIQNIRLRPIINSIQCEKVMNYIADVFETVPTDWKIRSREFGEKLQSGDIFQVSDVLKKLYFQNNLKALSFREQRIFEKAKFLVVSELAAVCSLSECLVEEKINELLAISSKEHSIFEIALASAAAAAS
jgi:CarD family transcriptional regulator